MGGKISDIGGFNRLFGQAGNDFISGGPASDRLSGGTGNDTLNGGPGFGDLCIGERLNNCEATS